METAKSWSKTKIYLKKLKLDYDAVKALKNNSDAILKVFKNFSENEDEKGLSKRGRKFI